MKRSIRITETIVISKIIEVEENEVLDLDDLEYMFAMETGLEEALNEMDDSFKMRRDITIKAGSTLLR